MELRLSDDLGDSSNYSDYDDVKPEDRSRERFPRDGSRRVVSRS